MLDNGHFGKTGKQRSHTSMGTSLVDILKDPKTQASFSSSVELTTSSPSEFGAMIKREIEKWKKVIVTAGLDKK